MIDMYNSYKIVVFVNHSDCETYKASASIAQVNAIIATNTPNTAAQGVLLLPFTMSSEGSLLTTGAALAVGVAAIV